MRGARRLDDHRELYLLPRVPERRLDPLRRADLAGAPSVGDGNRAPDVAQIIVHYGSTQATTTPHHGFFFAERTTTDRITEIDAVLDDGSTQAITLTPPPTPPAP
jgi:hypothetical protein